ncbi:hypothetical protein IWX84_003121 [Flavobacterium sp. CG_9.10]|uniref:hypothetical protein n=1 Tax=Flavobacterium sp. CG_9.10 TaxID=2787729 RepID=UPI0018CBC22E|nr:hypothetical protein [Flavobacterium sp. CG_9.10]MBG6112218.1 hypothetical protein [Flavobacterium sp. CG_9.10]
MKLKFIFLLLLIKSLNTFSQLNKTEKENIILIIEQTDPVVSEFIFNKNNSEIIIKEYQYDFKYGEYIKEEKPYRNSVLNYNSDGILKFDYWGSEISLGKKGEQLNKPYLKYKYNANGEIIGVFYYSNTSGALQKRFVFIYNIKNQISEIIQFNGESKSIESKSIYKYNLNGDKISLIIYQPTLNKKFPKFETLKVKWIYDNYNRLVAYQEYKNNYGYYSLELVKRSQGKLIDKTLEENLKEQKNNWKESKLLEFGYEKENPLWITRKEFLHKYNSIIDKDYKRLTELIIFN